MYTPIELDKVRNFRYGMKAVSLIEKSLGKSVSKLDFDNLTMEDTATIMWAGLVHEDKELTPDKVMNLIDDHSNIQSAVEIMGKAFDEAFGGNDKKKGKN
jgi:hypothetical protein